MHPLEELVKARVSRRDFLALMATLAAAPEVIATPHKSLGFTSVPVSRLDTVTVAPGYTARPFYVWGDPISNGPAWKPDASDTAAEQAQQAGMHHDGMQFFPLPLGSSNSRHGLLAVNHEYLAQQWLYPDGMATWSAEKFAKAGAAVGLSIVEVKAGTKGWQVVRPSKLARKVSLHTPIAIGGPARGVPAMRTAADPKGERVIGTYANCACGFTPWGTYLSCEENFHSWFAMPHGTPDRWQNAYQVRKSNVNRWYETEERFNLDKHPNEYHRFGWVVEVDPYDPASVPVKRTALGRFNRESAFTQVAKDGRVVCYSGDDDRFECIYKFVTRDKFNPRNRAANRDLLDHGTLYVAKFHEDGRGEWLPMVQGVPGLEESDGYATQADVVIHARLAAHSVGATPMDRPEWIAIHPHTGEVYVSLTNNNRRGAAGEPAADAANPRINNVGGHIVRWRESGHDAASTTFEWDVFLYGGEDHANPQQSGDAFGSPDTLRFSPQGHLWMGTDGGKDVGLGNDALLAADPRTGEVRRFLTGPRGCEITGLTFTPDGRTAFVNIQHPGVGVEKEPDWKPWPSGVPGDRPRSGTVVITKNDGGVIGS